MKHYRGYAALLALLCAASVITACGDDTTATPTGKDQGTASVQEEGTTSRWQDALPADIDLGGKTVVIHERGDESTKLELNAEMENGDVLNDAVYQRNRGLEERLNFKLQTYTGPGWADYHSELTKIRGSIAAGDNAWQIIAMWGINSSALVLENCFYDLTDMPYLDVTAPWWNQSAVEGLTLGGGRYFVTGDIAVLTMLGGSYVVFVNDTVCQKNDIESIPALVREGKWTIEKMTELSKSVMADIDGSGSMDEKDQYGLHIDLYNSADSFYTSADIHQISVVDGIPVYEPATERLTKLMELIYPFYYDGTSVGALMKIGDHELQYNKFMIGESMMIIRELDRARDELRDMEDDYTIVPMPKLDEEQKEYRTASYNGAAVLGIPTDNPDTDTALIVMEALAAASHYEITPTYFKTCLQEKYARNEETMEMLEIIRQTQYIDSEYLWGGVLNNPGYIMRDMLSKKNKDVASWIAKNEKATIKAIEDTIEKLEAMQNEQ